MSSGVSFIVDPSLRCCVFASLTSFQRVSSLKRVFRDGPGAEESRPDSNESGSLLDGDLEIVAHSHGELAAGEPPPESFGAELPQAAEIRPDGLRIRLVRREHHQPVDAQAGKAGQILEGGE